MQHASTSLMAAITVVALVAGCQKPVPEPPPERRYTFRALAGISMGAIGTSLLAGSGDNHARLDAVGAMGGPLDVAYFLDALERLQLGGTCSLARLEALAAENPAALDDPDALADCAGPQPTRWYETPQFLNHWRYTSNGGDFDRSSYLNLFHDLALGLGNPLTYNPDSSFFPHPAFTKADFDRADLCEKPVVIRGVHNAEYNPEGKYDVVSFCDGQAPIHYCTDAAQTPMDWCSGLTPQAFCEARGATVATATEKTNPALFFAKKGRVEPCWRPRERLGIALAVDINGNGRRDWHEPVLVNARERFEDVGTDGCGNEREDGRGGCTGGGTGADPNGDDYDLDNPLGTERNGIHDEGEPYLDAGLDGVPGTGDHGEGNGRYDESPNRQRFLAHDLRRRYLAMTPAERARIDVYADGGIRDVFNLGLSADHLHGAMRALEPDVSRRYTDFLQLPALDPSGWEDDFFYAPRGDFARAGRHVFVRYGLESPTERELRDGDGDHVGTNAQAVDRFQTFIVWLSARWDEVLGPAERMGGEARVEEITYFSEALGAPRSFQLALPPGYDRDTDRSYPLLLVMHGYGMDAQGMSGLSLIFQALMGSGEVRPMLIAYPSGRCCHVRDGVRDCRDKQDDGTGFDASAGWTTECTKGNFFVNRQGYGPGDERRYADAIFEQMDWIAAHYRVLPERTMPIGGPR